MDLSTMKNPFFSTEWCFRAKKICSKIDCQLLLYAKLIKLIGLLCWTKKVSFSSSKPIFNQFWLVKRSNTYVWAKTPDWLLWPKSSEKKEDLEIKYDFFLTKYIFKIMETQVYYNTIWFYTFLEHILVFLCKVQGV